MIALGAIVVQPALGHSWIEQMQVIGSNGSFVGNYGYPRGYVARQDPTFNGHSDMWLLPALDSGRLRINGSDSLCHTAQRTQNYSSQYPELTVSPGDWVALKYLENGHVTQPWVQAGKPSAGGTVYVYATTDPEPDPKIVDVMQWNSDGSGGNKKGWLLAAQNFDDERCHQISSSAISLFRQEVSPDQVAGQPDSRIEQWCETDIQIPQKVNGNSLTAYWVWQWPTAIGTVGAPEGKDEYYTTCMDFKVQASGNGSGSGTGIQAAAAAPAASPSFALKQQDPQSTAVSGYASRTALTPSPMVFTAGQTHTGNVNAAASPTISMLYTMAPSTFVASGTTYALSPQGTALQINGQLAAYVNCQNAVTTGSVAPKCPGSSDNNAGPTTLPKVGGPSAPEPAATSSSSVPPTSTITQQPNRVAGPGSGGVPCQTTTVYVTVTATTSPVVVEASPAVSPMRRSEENMPRRAMPFVG